MDAVADRQDIVHEARFRAMGSDAHVIVVGADRAVLDAQVARIAELEQRWSRFIDTSEISELNRHSGAEIAVSADTRLLVERAVEAWRITGGGFDPTVLGDVIRAGYDRSFERLPDSVRSGSSMFGKGASSIVVRLSTVRLPEGVGFDPGGIGKGLAADLVATEARTAGATGVCINLGGDLRVLGRPPVGQTWTVAIEHQLAADPIALVALDEGAVATSTTLRRRWTVAGEARHHLIDPWTGEPSETDIAFVTVVAGESWIAEVLAKAELLRGSARLFDLIGGSGAEAFAVTIDGHVHATDGIHRFVGPPGLPDHIELASNVDES
ncbi:MAG: FAD:protein FMN transferase [Acidimicrobiia bacterium]